MPADYVPGILLKKFSRAGCRFLNVGVG